MHGTTAKQGRKAMSPETAQRIAVRYRIRDNGVQQLKARIARRLARKQPVPFGMVASALTALHRGWHEADQHDSGMYGECSDLIWQYRDREEAELLARYGHTAESFGETMRRVVSHRWSYFNGLYPMGYDK